MLERQLITPILARQDSFQVGNLSLIFMFIFSGFSSFLVTCSDNNCPSQQLSEMISHVSHSDEDENNGDAHRGYTWVMIDLGLSVLPTHLSLRHGAGGFPHWTKTLLIQISKEGLHFTSCEILLVNETNNSTATWAIKNNFNDTTSGFRYIRIHQKSGRHPVCLAGFELYGQVLTAIDIRSSKFLCR